MFRSILSFVVSTILDLSSSSSAEKSILTTSSAV